MSYINEKVRVCIDMGDWKHSWHNKFTTLEDFKKCKDIIKEKISQRYRELETLNGGIYEIDRIISNEEEQQELFDSTSKALNALSIKG